MSLILFLFGAVTMAAALCAAVWFLAFWGATLRAELTAWMQFFSTLDRGATLRAEPTAGMQILSTLDRGHGAVASVTAGTATAVQQALPPTGWTAEAVTLVSSAMELLGLMHAPLTVEMFGTDKDDPTIWRAQLPAVGPGMNMLLDQPINHALKEGCRVPLVVAFNLGLERVWIKAVCYLLGMGCRILAPVQISEISPDHIQGARLKTKLLDQYDCSNRYTSLLGFRDRTPMAYAAQGWPEIRRAVMKYAENMMVDLRNLGSDLTVNGKELAALACLVHNGDVMADRKGTPGQAEWVDRADLLMWSVPTLQLLVETEWLHEYHVEIYKAWCEAEGILADPVNNPPPPPPDSPPQTAVDHPPPPDPTLELLDFLGPPLPVVAAAAAPSEPDREPRSFIDSLPVAVAPQHHELAALLHDSESRAIRRRASRHPWGGQRRGQASQDQDGTAETTMTADRVTEPP